MQTLPARFAVRAARIKMKIVVLDGDVINPGDISWAPLEKLGEVAIYGDTPEDLIVERAAGAEVLVTNKVPLRSGTLSRLPDLRMVAVLATGYDIIDTADAAAHGIPVCNVVAYGVDDVAQHAWALLLELCRRTGEHTASVCAGEWKDTWCYWKTTPVCLRGRTLGVIGFGSIGRRVGELGHAFGMSVLANCRTPRNPPSYSPFAFASTDQIFQQADVISLHCPLTDATRAIINAKALARMKPGAILINTARGPLLDEAAVAEALHSGKLGGLGVDVLAKEPPAADNPLLHTPNTLITPHGREHPPLAAGHPGQRGQRREGITNEPTPEGAGAASAAPPVTERQKHQPPCPFPTGPFPERKRQELRDASSTRHPSPSCFSTSTPTPSIPRSPTRPWTISIRSITWTAAVTAPSNTFWSVRRPPASTDASSSVRPRPPRRSSRPTTTP